MKKLSIKWLKDKLSKDGIIIDFRKDVYINNEYGCCPQINHSRAEDIIKKVHEILENETKDKFHIYNLSIEVEKLKTNTLKSVLEYYLDLCQSIK